MKNFDVPDYEKVYLQKQDILEYLEYLLCLHKENKVLRNSIKDEMSSLGYALQAHAEKLSNAGTLLTKERFKFEFVPSSKLTLSNELIDALRLLEPLIHESRHKEMKAERTKRNK